MFLPEGGRWRIFRRVVLPRTNAELSYWKRAFLRRNTEKYIRIISVAMTYKFCSEPPSQVNVIRKADYCLMKDMDEQRARWPSFLRKCTRVRLLTNELQIVDADPPINETTASLDEVRNTMAVFKGKRYAELLNPKVQHRPWVVAVQTGGGYSFSGMGEGTVKY